MNFEDLWWEKDMTLEDIKRYRWLAIYGALVAIQVQERFAQGLNGPSVEDMKGIIEEARAVADLENEANQAG